MGFALDLKRYRLTLLEPMLGTVPKDREIYASYIASKAPVDADDEVVTVPDELERSGWTGFHTDETGIFVYDYLIKGFLKEAGNTLKEQLGVKSLRSKLDQFVFVAPRRVYITDQETGEILTTPDSVVERPLRAMTAQGPRVALARSDAVDAGRILTVGIQAIPHKEVTFALIESLLDYGALKALGQFRNGGYGRISWEIVP